MIVLFAVISLIAIAVGVVLFVFRQRLPLTAPRATGSTGQLQARPLLPVLAPMASPAKQQLARPASQDGICSARSAASRQSISCACPARASVPSSATSAKAATQSLSLSSSASARSSSMAAHGSAEAEQSPGIASAHVPCSVSGLAHVTPDKLVPHPALPRIRTR